MYSNRTTTKRLEEVLEAQVYFSHPYALWKREINENINGLIRQYFYQREWFYVHHSKTSSICDEPIKQQT
jgi:IS30 family transposase